MIEQVADKYDIGKYFKQDKYIGRLCAPVVQRKDNGK